MIEIWGCRIAMIAATSLHVSPSLACDNVEELA